MNLFQSESIAVSIAGNLGPIDQPFGSKRVTRGSRPWKMYID